MHLLREQQLSMMFTIEKQLENLYEENALRYLFCKWNNVITEIEKNHVKTKEREKIETRNDFNVTRNLCQRFLVKAKKLL